MQVGLTLPKVLAGDAAMVIGDEMAKGGEPPACRQRIEEAARRIEVHN